MITYQRDSVQDLVNNGDTQMLCFFSKYLWFGLKGCSDRSKHLFGFLLYLTVRFGNYELDLSAIPAPITDDLTFAIEPPSPPEVVEANQAVPEPRAIEPPTS